MPILSVLDQSPIRAGATAADAVHETLALARHCERLGYHRYWVAEHHSSGALAGAAPEILIARIASLTDRIRVGSGGVMLSHYAPLKVAEQFRMLETLFPGRIDMGLGRAPGSDMMTAVALAQGHEPTGPDAYPGQVLDLIGFLRGTLAKDHPFARIRAMPEGDGMPEPWLLGSSDQSAMIAAYLGLPYSFAHFISDVGGPQAMDSYRSLFRPSAIAAQPTASIGVFVICAETEAEAERLAASRDLWRLRLDRADPGPFPTVEEALAYPYSEAERARVRQNRRRMVVGDPAQARAGLEELARRYGVDELVVVTICHDPEARRRSYALLAEAFALVPA